MTLSYSSWKLSGWIRWRSWRINREGRQGSKLIGLAWNLWQIAQPVRILLGRKNSSLTVSKQYSQFQESKTSISNWSCFLFTKKYPFYLINLSWLNEDYTYAVYMKFHQSRCWENQQNNRNFYLLLLIKIESHQYLINLSDLSRFMVDFLHRIPRINQHFYLSQIDFPFLGSHYRWQRIEVRLEVAKENIVEQAKVH